MFRFFQCCRAKIIFFCSRSFFAPLLSKILAPAPQHIVFCHFVPFFRVGHPFFSKERYVLFALFRSLEKNGKERNVLLCPISRQKLEKRT